MTEVERLEASLSEKLFERYFYLINAIAMTNSEITELFNKEECGKFVKKMKEGEKLPDIIQQKRSIW